MSGLSVPASKVYDGTTAAVVSGSPGSLTTAEATGHRHSRDGKPYTGDTVSITGTATGTYNSKDVATATTVTFGGLSLTGGQAADYSLTVQAQAGDHHGQGPDDERPVGAGEQGLRRHDGGRGERVAGVAGTAEGTGSGTTADGKPYTGDTVSLTGTATGTYNSKDVATATTVTFGGLSLTGSQAADYSLTVQSPASGGDHGQGADGIGDHGGSDDL